MAELRTLLPIPSPVLSIPPEQPKPKRTPVTRNRKAEGRIIDAVLEWFSEDDLREMALEMGVNYDAILGSGLKGKIAGIVDRFAKHGILPELVDVLVTERPHVDWVGMLLDTNELK